ncbi:MAG: hypothetical protein MJ231_02590 [bacterium]|nr:hypothetical protein [bacterium]
MSLVSSEITNLQNQTAFSKTTVGETKSTDTSDSNVFLTLMLEQMKSQDPTEPTDNTEWLSQLAQYSSLEQMTQMNSGLSNCMQYMQAMYSDTSTNAEITQTLSLIGKDVTLTDPADETGKKTITGKVSEASFEDGSGKVKVNGEYYSIANIVSVRDNTVETDK